MSTEMPGPDVTKKEVPAVEAEGGSREMALAAHAAEQTKREAFVQEGGVIVEEPGIAAQDPQEAQSDREKAEDKEQAKRDHFFTDLVEKFPELTDAQREAVRATMDRERTRSWGDYDGKNVTIKRITVEGNVLTIVVDIDDMFMTVHENVQF